MPRASRPSIVIPGIEGSVLQNFYPIDPVTTWSTFKIVEGKLFAPDFGTLALSDDAKSDRAAEVVTRPSQLIDVAYATLASGLQGRNGVPAYLFAYDWRYSIVHSATELVRIIEQLQLKAIRDLPTWNRHFDFACHSIGGIVFRQFLSEWMRLKPGVQLPVGRVVFIATPHKGSLDAARALISGESPRFGGQKEMRKLARTFPSVYELLPLYQNGVMRAEKNGVEVDLFKEQNWQVNTTSALPDANNSGFDVQQVHLTDAERVLRALPMPTDPRYGIAPGDLLVVYGSKPNSTLHVVEVQNDSNQWYDFDNALKDLGDDVVLVQSAKLPGVVAVEIRQDDVSYFSHPLLRGLVNSDLHAFLPALDEVQTIVANFFAGVTGEALLPINLKRDIAGRIS
jgi:lecithin:cholesterol acyltransferase